jgi:hypothetical protein
MVTERSALVFFSHAKQKRVQLMEQAGLLNNHRFSAILCKGL